MPRLANPDRFELGDKNALRERRDRLLREAEKRKYRLHRLSGLTRALQDATNELLRLELEAGQKPETSLRQIKALGDAGAVGGSLPNRRPYKD